MMLSENLPVLQPFILSWNLRNILERPSMLTPEEFCVIGIGLGEYPIDAWKPLFLETPRDGHKKDIGGRLNSAMGISLDNTKWNRKRTVNLPIYSHTQNYDVERLKIVIKHWNDIGFPDDVPCLALAVKCRGFYSDSREAQYVTVLIVWSDAVARIISLDWCEGPLEDCITPEWHIETTSLLNLKDAINRMRNIYENTHWDNLSFWIYPIPSCLGRELHGNMENTSYNLWNQEWRYTNYSELKGDLDILLSKVKKIFFLMTNGSVRHMANMLTNNLIEAKEKVMTHEEKWDQTFDEIERIINKNNVEKSALIAILFDIQAEYNYLPRKALVYVARRLDIPLILIYSIATFYKAFSLTPRGKHLLTVCLGTACHVRGAIGVKEEIERKLGITPGETTEDGNFSLETVNCLGSCALGPIVVVNGEYHGRMIAAKVKTLLDGIKSDKDEN